MQTFALRTNVAMTKAILNFIAEQLGKDPSMTANQVLEAATNEHQAALTRLHATGVDPL